MEPNCYSLTPSLPTRILVSTLFLHEDYFEKIILLNMELLPPNLSILFWSFAVMMILALPLIALINLLKSKFKDNSIKLVWLLVIIFIPIIGSILYLIIGKRQRIIKLT